MSPITITVEAILFDMDGTLINSTPGVLQAWKTFSADYNLGDSTKIAHATHGRRLYDTLKEYCGIAVEERLLEEIDRFEDEVIKGGPAALPGTIDLITKLSSDASSSSRWTIVTSASNKYAPRALERSGVPLPSRGLITSNDVPRGKPHPDPYLAGAALLGIDPSKCLVVEDAISGLKAGRAASALTLAVCTSTERDVIVNSDAKPDFIVADLTKYVESISRHFGWKCLCVLALEGSPWRPWMEIYKSQWINHCEHLNQLQDTCRIWCLDEVWLEGILNEAST